MDGDPGLGVDLDGAPEDTACAYTPQPEEMGGVIGYVANGRSMGALWLCIAPCTLLVAASARGCSRALVCTSSLWLWLTFSSATLLLAHEGGSPASSPPHLPMSLLGALDAEGVDLLLSAAFASAAFFFAWAHRGAEEGAFIEDATSNLSLLLLGGGASVLIEQSVQHFVLGAAEERERHAHHSPLLAQRAALLGFALLSVILPLGTPPDEPSTLLDERGKEHHQGKRSAAAPAELAPMALVPISLLVALPWLATMGLAQWPPLVPPGYAGEHMPASVSGFIDGAPAAACMLGAIALFGLPSSWGLLNGEWRAPPKGTVRVATVVARRSLLLCWSAFGASAALPFAYQPLTHVILRLVLCASAVAHLAALTVYGAHQPHVCSGGIVLPASLGLLGCTGAILALFSTTEMPPLGGGGAGAAPGGAGAAAAMVWQRPRLSLGFGLPDADYGLWVCEVAMLVALIATAPMLKMHLEMSAAKAAIVNHAAAVAATEARTPTAGAAGVAGRSAALSAGYHRLPDLADGDTSQPPPQSQGTPTNRRGKPAHRVSVSVDGHMPPPPPASHLHDGEDERGLPSPPRRGRVSLSTVHAPPPPPPEKRGTSGTFTELEMSRTVLQAPVVDANALDSHQSESSGSISESDSSGSSYDESSSESSGESEEHTSGEADMPAPADALVPRDWTQSAGEGTWERRGHDLLNHGSPSRVLPPGFPPQAAADHTRRGERQVTRPKGGAEEIRKNASLVDMI